MSSRRAATGAAVPATTCPPVRDAERDGRADAARRIKNTALACAAAVMAAVALLYLTLPRLVLRPFLDPGAAGDAEAVSTATQLLFVIAVLQLFDCAQNIGVGLLRGLDDTKSGFRITLIGYWLIGLPAAWLLGHTAGLGTLGVRLGLLAGLASTAILLLRRYGTSLRTHSQAAAVAA
ncbi:MATE family efflux transporter [Streptomyces klenkii]